MTLKQFYDAIGGNYEDVVARLFSEQIVKKFLFKFLNDGSYDTLVKSLAEGNYEVAFRSAHTIKGVCQNLSFDKLLVSSSALTEALRNGRSEEYAPLAEKVKSDYEQTIEKLKELQQEEN